MILPSVTQVLSPYVDFSGVRPEVLKQAAERGTKVHRYIAARLQGLILPAIEADMEGFVASWEAWAAEQIERVYLVEAALKDKIFGYHGHLDAVIKIYGDTKLTIIDWKTPIQAQKTWELQVAAYRRLAEVAGYDIGRMISVRIDRNNGRAKIKEYIRYEQSLGVFLAALSVWRYLN